MTEEKFTYRYYIVGNRPVKIEIDDEGLDSDCLALNWKTGEFDRNFDYFGKIEKNDIDTNEVSEETFDKRVQTIKDNKKKANLSKPRM